jgi:hypothetical protein
MGAFEGLRAEVCQEKQLEDVAAKRAKRDRSVSTVEVVEPPTHIAQFGDSGLEACH